MPSLDRVRKYKRATIKIDYNPLPSQIEAHNNPAQFRAMVGGFGSGKTTFGSREVLRWTQQFCGGLFLIGRLHATDLRDTTQRRFFEIIDSMTEGKPEKLIERWNENRGHLWLKTPVPGVYSEVLFRHLDEAGQLGSLDLDGWWIDECHEPDGDAVPESVYKILKARLRGVVGPLRGLITSNSGGKNWVWKNFFSSMKLEGHWGIAVSSWENKENLPPGYIEGLVANNDPDWVKRYIDCSFDVFEGQIFPEFNEDRHTYDPAEVELEGGVIEAGFDFGIAAPTSVPVAHIIPADPGDECTLPYVYIFDEFYGAEADIRVVAEFIKKHKPRIIWADPAVQARGAGGESPLMLYAREGVALTPAINDVDTKIATIHQFLLRDRLKIAKHCRCTIESIQAYRWRPVREGGDEKERPVKANDHAVDAIGYLLMGNPYGRKLDPIEPGRAVSKQKSGLYIAADGSFRHSSLDEDLDTMDDLLSPGEYELLLLGGNEY